MKIIQFLTVLILTTVIGGQKKTFEGAKLYKVVPKTRNEVSVLEYLRDTGVGDFWIEYFKTNDDVKIMVEADMQPFFLEQLKEESMDVTIIIDNVQKAVDDQMKPALAQRSSKFLSHDWESYHNLTTIEAWMEELAREYPNIVSLVTMPVKSVEGRDIKGVKIDYSPGRQKPLAMLEGTLHAREWISTVTITWILKEFLTSTDPDVRIMAENLEWHIFPVVNPDGYAYTFNGHRMWRKNRSRTNFTTCVNSTDDMSNGVDLNRNFDFHWMEVGASTDPCSNLFGGPSAASEPETRAISQYVLSLKEKGPIVYYLSFHSFTQLFILPYSHVEKLEDFPADNYEHLFEIGNNAAKKLGERFNTNYTVGISADVLYPMGGSSFDWVKFNANASVTYLIELRDMGEYGFLLPAEQIIPNNLEIMDAMIEMDRTTRRLGYYSSSSNIVFSLSLLVFGIMFANLF